MPVLRVDDPLPVSPRRVLVAGTSGVGKTTLARQLADVWRLPCTELDALFHGPGWAPRSSFAAEVAALAAGASWVTEWQYDLARPLLAARADLLVWLDLPRRVVLWRVVRRTVLRRARRTVLWNGNREPALRTLLTDREHVVRWAWRTHPNTAALVHGVIAQRPDLAVVRLRTAREVARWSSRLPR